MALTDEQITQLFRFTKKKLVHYYDLQVELVDHLASSIEDEMTADPELSFDNALQKVYNRFGIFGFAKVVQERTAALQKSNRRIYLEAAKEFFIIPKIALTAFIFFGAFFISGFLTGDFKGLMIFAIWLAFTAVHLILGIRSKRQTRKKLLLTQYSNVFAFPGLVLPYYIFIVDWGSIENNYMFASFTVLVVIVESAIIQVNSQVRKKAMQLYPEAFAAHVKSNLR